MSLEKELKAFYTRVGFGEAIGKRTLLVPVYTGCLLVPLPNIELRHKYLKYHDLHHLLTGFSVGRIGEGEVSSWELGTGSFFVNPVLGIMNLIALSTGLALEPRRMWQAYKLGISSKNLYKASTRAAIDQGDWSSVHDLKSEFYKLKPIASPSLIRSAEFGVYVAVSVVIHAAIALPALLLRVCTDFWMSKSIIQAIKPVKRGDLY